MTTQASRGRTASLLRALATLAIGALTLVVGTHAHAEGETRLVRVETICLSDPHPAMTLSGTVSARIQAPLGFRVGGKIIERPVNLGDRVREGSLLARLDPADLHLATEAASSAAIAAAADAVRSRADLARYQSLGRGSPAFIAEELDRRIAAANGANARFEQARRQLSLAEAQESYAVLRAGADGVIASLPVEVGQVVAAGQTVAELAHSGETEVRVDVPETRLDSLRAASAIEIVAEGRPGGVPSPALHGHLREVAGVADPQSRTFAAKIALTPGDAASLPLGATVTVRFLPSAGPLVAVVPATSLVGGGAVWVLDEAAHHAVRRDVSILSYDGQGHAIIGAGLRNGDEVITAGADLVSADMILTAWQGPTR